jgi:mannitol/fructose-specific phosphotransferase system IIA component (Ntr-type)
MLLEVINKDYVITQARAEDWREVGKMAGQLLVDKGIVEPSYIDATLKAVEDFGMYIVVAPGIALFHSRPEDGVNAVGLSLVTLADGVNFGVEGKDPVKLAFALAAVDNKAHLGLLAGLSAILQDTSLVQELMDAESPKIAVDLIKNKLRQGE